MTRHVTDTVFQMETMILVIVLCVLMWWDIGVSGDMAATIFRVKSQHCHIQDIIAHKMKNGLHFCSNNLIFR